MKSRSFRRCIAHAASPWECRQAPFAAYVVGVLAASVSVVAVPLVGHGLSDGLIPATVGLVFAGTYLRALVRSMRMRRAGTVEAVTSLS